MAGQGGGVGVVVVGVARAGRAGRLRLKLLSKSVRRVVLMGLLMRFNSTAFGLYEANSR